MRQFVVYCHTNRVNGKKYVGKSVSGMLRRWKQHVEAARRHKLAECRAFYAAIRKYGFDAWDHEVLEECLFEKALADAEVRWIAQLNTRVPNGYNLSAGGGAGSLHPETRARIGRANAPRLQAWHAALTPEQRSEIYRKREAGYTPEDRRRRSECTRVVMAAMSPEERSKRAFRAQASRAPEERSATARKRDAAMTSEQRSARARKASASRTPEQRTAIGRKSWAGLTAEQRRRRCVVADVNMTPEQLARRRALAAAGLRAVPPGVRSARSRKGQAARTPEQRSAGARKAGEANGARWARMTPDERHVSGAAAIQRMMAALSPEQLHERALKSARTRLARKAGSREREGVG